MWARVVMAIVGVWLMASPGVFGFDKTISDNAHIVGPLIVTFSIIAIAEATRNVKWANLPLGAWLLLAPWVLQYDNTTAMINDSAIGVLTILLSFVKMKRENSFAGGWPAVWRDDTPHARKAGNPSRIRLKDS